MDFVLSVCSSVHTYDCPHVTIWLPPHKFSLNLKFDNFLKSIENVKVRQKSDKWNGNFKRGLMYIYINILCVIRLWFVTATRCGGHVRIGLWRVRSLWKLGYWTAVWLLLHKQQEKFLLGTLGVAQLIREFVCIGNPQFSYCLQELAKLRTYKFTINVNLLPKFVYCLVQYMHIFHNLVHTTVSKVMDL
jgi:hypothetical protein